MKEHRVGIIMNGVTGRMGTNQHLIRSILAIRQQGGVKLGPGETIVPEPLLVGRNTDKLRALAAANGVERYTTDLDAALKDAKYQIYFDAGMTQHRVENLRKALAAKKHIYCEKPTAIDTAGALAIYKEAQRSGLKHGVVQDKLWLPGLLKLKYLLDTGALGDVLSARGEFGYWVFDGYAQACQRPSWNYRKEDGGGIIVDMLCHWRYVIDNLFGNVKAVSCLGATHVPKRVDENGKEFACTTDDAAYATFLTERGVICHFNSSWCVRVRRDDLLTVQVDGTKGSAVAGLRRCFVQHDSYTPKPVWNPDIDQPINFFSNWEEVPNNRPYDNAFKIQWELFLRHVVKDEPFRWGLLEGAKGVQLAEKGLESWAKRAWVDLPSLD
ncbi:MAG: Gfo/Idh/MocA family oxidoreductase [Planctomycetota bacterium]|nr:Gfo/Idh/MocA family oxidoreductase [Planctomycetota bacterium]